MAKYKKTKTTKVNGGGMMMPKKPMGTMMKAKMPCKMTSKGMDCKKGSMM